MFKRGSILRGDGHLLPDYEKVLRIGLRGIAEQVREELRNLDLTDAKGFTLLQAVLIVLRAAIKFAHRFSGEARKLAEKEESLQKEGRA